MFLWPCRHSGKVYSFHGSFLSRRVQMWMWRMTRRKSDDSDKHYEEITGVGLVFWYWMIRKLSPTVPFVQCAAGEMIQGWNGKQRGMKNKVRGTRPFITRLIRSPKAPSYWHSSHCESYFITLLPTLRQPLSHWSIIFWVLPRIDWHMHILCDLFFPVGITLPRKEMNLGRRWL